MEQYNETPLRRAIAMLGGQNATARALGVKQGTVWSWLKKTKHGISPQMARSLEGLTGGKITRGELRPDVFGEPL